MKTTKQMCDVIDDVEVIRIDGAPTTGSRGGDYSVTKTTHSTGKVETTEFNRIGAELARYAGHPRDTSADA